MSTGIISRIAGNGNNGYGGDGGVATSAILMYPSGLFVDSAGNVYIADSNNRRVRKVSVCHIYCDIIIVMSMYVCLVS